jgi:hypothetical protein
LLSQATAHHYPDVTTTGPWVAPGVFDHATYDANNHSLFIVCNISPSAACASGGSNGTTTNEDVTGGGSTQTVWGVTAGDDAAHQL